MNLSAADGEAPAAARHAGALAAGNSGEAARRGGAVWVCALPSRMLSEQVLARGGVFRRLRHLGPLFLQCQIGQGHDLEEALRGKELGRHHARRLQCPLCRTLLRIRAPLRNTPRLGAGGGWPHARVCRLPIHPFALPFPFLLDPVLPPLMEPPKILRNNSSPPYNPKTLSCSHEWSHTLQQHRLRIMPH